MSLNVTSLHQRIHQRSGHIAVVYKNYLLVWGGYREPRDLIAGIDQEYHATDEIWLYDCNTELWDRVLTSGNTPRLVCGSCGVVLDEYLYVFGGYCRDGSGEGNSDKIHRLDLTTMTWYLLTPDGPTPSACDKLAGWAYKDKVYFFAGFGPCPEHRSGFSFEVLETALQEGRGWNNQLVAYNPKNNRWEWPRVSGTAPSPRAAHSADISGHKAYIFGGRFRNHRLNDLYCLDLDLMTWSSNLTVGGDVPEGRSWHSFTFVSPDRAVVYGGLSNRNTVLNDCWLLDVVDMSWSSLFAKCKLEPRYWHATRLTGTRELLSVGANYDPDHPDNMLIMDFAPKSLLRLCLRTVLQRVPFPLWAELPRTLKDLLVLRAEQNTLTIGPDGSLDNLPEIMFSW